MISYCIRLGDGKRWQYVAVAISRLFNAFFIKEPDCMVCSAAALLYEKHGEIPDGAKFWIYKFVWNFWPFGKEHCKQCLDDELNKRFEPGEKSLNDLYEE